MSQDDEITCWHLESWIFAGGRVEPETLVAGHRFVKDILKAVMTWLYIKSQLQTYASQNYKIETETCCYAKQVFCCLKICMKILKPGLPKLFQ